MVKVQLAAEQVPELMVWDKLYVPPVNVIVPVGGPLEPETETTTFTLTTVVAGLGETEVKDAVAVAEPDDEFQ
jgi:hypothetical protein